MSLPAAGAGCSALIGQFRHFHFEKIDHEEPPHKGFAEARGKLERFRRLQESYRAGEAGEDA